MSALNADLRAETCVSDFTCESVVSEPGKHVKPSIGLMPYATASQGKAELLREVTTSVYKNNILNTLKLLTCNKNIDFGENHIKGSKQRVFVSSLLTETQDLNNFPDCK
jgi:hypothetical protein